MKTNKNISRRSFVKKTSIMSSGVMISNQSIYEDLFLNKSDGPYFGNGCKNGWADQNSISIWSRLTKKPNANWKGEKFIDISKEDHKSYLSKLKNPKEIYKAQIPFGLKLKYMQGACIGVEGEVKIEYYPENDKLKRNTIDWKPNDSEKDFTIPWRLRGWNVDCKDFIIAKSLGAELGDFITDTLKKNGCN